MNLMDTLKPSTFVPKIGQQNESKEQREVKRMLRNSLRVASQFGTQLTRVRGALIALNEKKSALLKQESDLAAELKRANKTVSEWEAKL